MNELIADRYLIESRIGGGQQGAVYRAHDRQLDRHVALKMIHGVDVSSSASETLKREALLLARFENPHFVRIYDYLVGEEGQPVIVMQLIDGLPLSQTLGRLTIDDVRLLVTQVCGAMHDAHSAGLIHRDLKPANIMHQGHRTDKQCFVVLDLGIGKLLEASELSSTVMQRTFAGGGTPLYMAPEQWNAKSGDARSDVYAFGCILYEVLTGRTPFGQHAENFATLCQAILTEKPQSPRNQPLKLQVPPQVDDLILRCLEKDPSQRPGSMTELADEFLTVLNSASAEETGISGTDTIVPDSPQELTAPPDPRPPVPARLWQALIVLLIGGTTVGGGLGLWKLGQLSFGSRSNSSKKSEDPPRNSPEERSSQRESDGEPEAEQPFTPTDPPPISVLTEITTLLNEIGGSREYDERSATNVIRVPVSRLSTELGHLLLRGAKETGATYRVLCDDEKVAELGPYVQEDTDRIRLDISDLPAGDAALSQKVLAAFNQPDALAAVNASYTAEFTDESLNELLTKQHRLEALDLQDSGVLGKAQLPLDFDLSHLKVLNISFTEIPGAYIVELLRDSTLEELTASYSRLDAVAFMDVDLSGLRVLDWSGTLLPDFAIADLATRASRLETLRLIRTEVSDAALAKLVSLRALKVLDVTGTGIGTETKNKLRSAIPALNLIAD